MFLGLDYDELIIEFWNNTSFINGCPDHIYVGTDAENQADRAARITHCKNGHLFDETNTKIRINSTGTHRECKKCNSTRTSARRKIRKLLNIK